MQTMDELRKEYVAWVKRLHKGSSIGLPLALTGLRCGAKTKSTGQPCKQKVLYGLTGRCKFHGGLSTGPKTEAGKRQAAINGKNGGRPKKRSGV